MFFFYFKYFTLKIVLIQVNRNDQFIFDFELYCIINRLYAETNMLLHYH